MAHCSPCPRCLSWGVHSQRQDRHQGGKSERAHQALQGKYAVGTAHFIMRFLFVVVGAVAALPASVYLPHSPSGLQELEQVFWAVSDPASPSYGAFISREEAARLLQPAPSHAAALSAALATVGLHCAPNTPGFRCSVELPVGMSVEALEAAVGHIPGVVVLGPRGGGGPDPVAAFQGQRHGSAHAPPRRAHQGQGGGDPLPGAPDPQSCLANQCDPPCLRRAYGLDSVVYNTSGGCPSVPVWCVWTLPVDLQNGPGFTLRVATPFDPFPHCCGVQRTGSAWL
jgi:hypothetical protein